MTARACPGCGGALASGHVANALAGVLGVAEVEIDRCLGCGGAFLDAHELGWLTGDMRIDRGDARDEGAGAAAAADAPPAARACPSCGGGMARSSAEGAAFDACGNCRGLWFERDEAARFLP